MLSLCTLQLPSVHPPVDPACSPSIIFSPPQSSQGSRARSSFNALIVRRTVAQILSSDPLLPRSTAAKRRADDSTVTWRLYQCSTSGTKNEGFTADCNPNKKTVKWDTNVDGVLTSSSESEATTASRSAESTTPRFASHVHNRRQTEIYQLTLKSNGHGSHVP